MPQSDPIDFWFSIGSMYTFLTVMRIDRVEDTTDIRFVWRPFSVRAIMIEMDNRPMSKPKKLEYLWRDLHRRAEMYGFAFEGEAPYPLKSFDLANRVSDPLRGARFTGAQKDLGGRLRQHRLRVVAVARFELTAALETEYHGVV